jgi:hypothetical protein
MRKYILIFVFCFASAISFGQKYYTDHIIKTADSIMVAAVGQKIFDEHYKFDSNSYYESKNLLNKSIIKRITKTKKTKGDIKFINVQYKFYVGKFEQPFIWSGLLFDKFLKLENPVDTSYIPKFILHGTTSHFLTENDILKIAKDKFQKSGIKPIELSLTFNHSRKEYVWSIVNIIHEWQDAYDNIQRQVDLLEVNATSGEIIFFSQDAIQGKIY